ncbi:N utilization substance protein B [Bacteroidia bacterium]|nr:N utilization substance protein B [Bacteroidia bacterium]
MINRRYIREKTLQSLYGYYQKGQDDLLVTEKNLVHGLERVYELYISLADVLVAVKNYAHTCLEGKKHHLTATADEKKPNLKFVNNLFIKQLEESPSYILQTTKSHISLAKESEIIRQLYLSIEAATIFKTYLSDTTQNYEEDRKLVYWMLKRKIASNELLTDFFEGQDLWWNTDFQSVVYWLQQSVKTAQQDATDVLASATEFLNAEDQHFAVQLLRQTALNDATNIQHIERYLNNWELTRTPLIDALILKMAITELLKFPSIPTKVTLNEYIELSKLFSAEESYIFINGLLDRFIEDGIKNKTIKKSGRGLIE